MVSIKVGDILRPEWTGRGTRSYKVTDIDNENGTMWVVRYNVTTGATYGEKIETTYEAIVAKWERNQKRQGADSAPRYESRWEARAQWTHGVWNHAPEPIGANAR